MPRISEFFGIVISRYYNDHAPAHFHATYAEHEALIEIGSLGIYRGSLPPRALSMVIEWAVRHRDELWDDWERARRGEPLEPIEPLR